MSLRVSGRSKLVVQLLLIAAVALSVMVFVSVPNRPADAQTPFYDWRDSTLGLNPDEGASNLELVRTALAQQSVGNKVAIGFYGNDHDTFEIVRSALIALEPNDDVHIAGFFLGDLNDEIGHNTMDIYIGAQQVYPEPTSSAGGSVPPTTEQTIELIIRSHRTWLSSLRVHEREALGLPP